MPSIAKHSTDPTRLYRLVLRDGVIARRGRGMASGGRLAVVCAAQPNTTNSCSQPRSAHTDRGSGCHRSRATTRLGGIACTWLRRALVLDGYVGHVRSAEERIGVRRRHLAVNRLDHNLTRLRHRVPAFEGLPLSTGEPPAIPSAPRAGVFDETRDVLSGEREVIDQCHETVRSAVVGRREPMNVLAAIHRADPCDRRMVYVPPQLTPSRAAPHRDAAALSAWRVSPTHLSALDSPRNPRRALRRRCGCPATT